MNPSATTEPDGTQFATWALVELMGHRRLVARVTEQTIAGRGFLRLDEPATEGHEPRTQIVSPDAIYAMHPITEDLAVAIAPRFRAEPITVWDLPKPLRDAINQAKAKTPAELEAKLDNDEHPF